MAVFRTFSGFLTSEITSTGSVLGGTFDVTGLQPVELTIQDGPGDAVLEGDVVNETASDGDQFGFAESGGVPLFSDEPIYLESIFTFSIGGESFTGFQIETDPDTPGDASVSIVVLPPDIPPGVATVNSQTFAPSPNQANFDDIFSAAEMLGPNDPGGPDLSGDDTILAGDGDDTIDAGSGDDSVEGGDGADSLTGAAGDDELFGGEGDDTLVGDGGAGGVTLTRESFNWSELPDPNGGGDIDGGDDLSDGGFQITGGTRVDFGYTPLEPGTSIEFFSGFQRVSGLEGDADGVDNRSGAILEGSAGAAPGDTSRLELSFSAAEDGVEDAVRNVQFRVSDIDELQFRDQVAIFAFGPDDEPIPVSLSGGSRLVLSDEDDVPGAETATTLDGFGLSRPTSARASLLVEVAGPVSRIEIDYSNEETARQTITVTDVFFDSVQIEEAGGEGDDFLSGGEGDDVLFGGEGADTLDLLGDDEASGGAGPDVFVVPIDPGSIAQITDFDATTNVDNLLDFDADADQTDNDFTDLSGFFDSLNDLRDANLSNPGEDVRLDLGNGQVLEFQGVADVGLLNFENVNVVCFVRGALVQTAKGERPIEDLRAGDLIETMDHGPQPIRWIGSRALTKSMLEREERLRPVTIRAGAFGAHRDLRVSPQHRVLVSGARTELLFGSTEVLVKAKDLIDGRTVFVDEPDAVEYFHILFGDHEVITVDGVASESFHPGVEAVSTLEQDARDEVLSLFPELGEGTLRPLARPALRSFEAQALTA